ncbi:MAG: tetratricopeptide repeat protein [bacterium]|nr:tetratricopeptide repeat protein [bacterium]
MYELGILLIFSVLAFRTAEVKDEDLSPLPRKVSDKLGNLWNIAHQGMRDNRFLRAEKALLTILKIDQKNAAAYNRLGILYAKQKEYKDAIDCFEIATTIESSPSSLHNLGLIYYETENYDKAATAFEQALKLEDGLAARHIAYAKVQEKLGNQKALFRELELAVELEPSKESFSLLAKAYESHDKHDELEALKKRLGSIKLINKNQPNRVKRPKRRVVI